jgi:hypothetical protein
MEPEFQINGFQYRPLDATVVEPSASTLSPTDGAIRFVGTGAAIDLDVIEVNLEARAEGRFRGVGTVALSDIEVIATLATSIGGDGLPTVDIAAIESVHPSGVDISGLVWTPQTGTATPSAAALRFVEDFFRTSAALGDAGRLLTESIATMLGELVASVDVVAPAETRTVLGLDGSPIELSFMAAPTRIETTASGLVLGLGTEIAPMTGGSSSPGTAVRGDRFAPSAAAMGIGNAVSVDAINQVLHAVWAGGGAAGIVGPTMIVGPSMIVGPTMNVSPAGIVGPTMIDVATALPPVAGTTAAGELALTFGGMTLMLDGTGVFTGGLRVVLGGRAVASLDSSSGTRISVASIAIEELTYESDPQVPDYERLELDAWLVVFAHHFANAMLGDAQTDLALPSVAVPTEVEAAGLRVPTGTIAGTRLGTGAPTLSVTPGHIESIGALAEMLPP